MYAGTSIEICALEKFVHLGSVVQPPMVLVSIDIPDDEGLVFRPAPAALPSGWADLPMSAVAQAYGRQWLEAATALVMLVPSAIIPEATNALINPAHPAYRRVVLTKVRDFTFDARMFKAP